MKTDKLITRFLDGLTSLEEERLLSETLEAQTTLTEDERAVLDLLRLTFPEEDTAALLTEDVSQSTNHHSQFFIRRLVVVSGIAAAAILIAFILWPTKNIPISQPLSGERSAHLGERAEATTQQPALEATVAQPQPTISSKALAERKRKKTIPKPILEPQTEEVPDEPQTEETAHPIELYEASYRPQIDEIMTVEELRARGNRLTENIRQQLQAINVTY